MEPLSCAASVIAVIQLTGSIVTICGGYIQEVKDAREDIASLQRQATSLLEIVKKLAELVNGQNGEKLSTSQTLANDTTSCKLVLTRLMERIDPENARKRTKAMRKLGFRALKWPLKRAELERMTQDLERYKSSFILALQKFNLEALLMAHGAEFDSYMDQHETECLPGTRTELCRVIKEWAVSSNGKSIFWLNGLAGTGKSTISRTMAKSFQQDGLLGASFFFKRGEGDRGNATKLFPTIIRQLLTRHPELLPAVMRVIKDDPRISGKPLKEQFEKLLLQPLLGLESASHHPLTIVIPTSLHLRAFVTSRPELPIRLGFRAVGNDHQDLILHEVHETVIKHDISLFLQHKLDAIRQERSLSPDWPGDVNVQTLLKMSVPLFIFAATICRLFEDHDLDPVQCFTEILKYKNEEEMNQKLTVYCLSVMRDQLKKNMCSFQSYGRERRDIDSQSINQYLPPELHNDILAFLKEHFLHWVEAMSILGNISEVVEGITNLQSAIHNNKGSEISQFLHDAKRFILKNSQVADIAPLQIYASSLIFAPKMAIIRRNFERELPDWIDRGPEGHLDTILSVAFSSDGRLLASGSHPVYSVAFSLDGRLLASSSRDKTIKLWDPTTGALKQTLEGHSNWVQSVAFSSDGRLLASGSHDKTIKLWDPTTGALKHTISTDRPVTCIGFSKKLPYLITNLGSFNIQAWHESFSSDSSETKPEISLQAGRWVAVQGHKELWLPPNYQPISFAIKDGTIALGCKNGRVCIIAFSI
ncbi:hypothetical protein BJX99DRAFT_268041 [Aspergillus californicus]